MRGEIDPGVGRVKEALRRLGQPEVDLRGRCLHVAGTNGKGSVCAMLFAVCRHAGFRVGMFTSPHLLEPLDAIQMAEEGEETPVQPETWKLLEEEVKKLCGHATPEISLTIFELQVVTSLLLFARHQVDVAIIEVGMGGLEDATNVLLEPAACCITSIALDHEKFLGPTHEDIAKHKAGIFQRGRPAYVAKDGMSESVQRVIAEVAERVGALLFWVAPAEVVGEPPHGRGRGHQTLQVPGFDPVQVPLLGNYQRSNAALALAMLVELRATKLPLRSCAKILDDHQLDNSIILEGMAKTRWPGRLDWIHLDGRPVLLDGAHNPHAAAELARYVDQTVRPKAVLWVVALSFGKDAKGILQELLREEDSLLAVTFPAVEAMPWVKPQAPEELVEVARSLPAGGGAQTAATWREALQVFELK
ncbi:Probable dihydrofolate synthetase (DHFS) [Durusdinium trenchii]|uniref:Probable dihydrofolate synthetase (DHFS) n=1 Tax=Durusdinium trenchii TaxID=1381693 RepID=A0ABP0S4W2_9DINO